MSMIMMYKQSTFPDIPMDSDLVFHLFLFMYGLITMSLQYINIYRTVWWLPQSHAAYGLNFDMIDLYLVVILILIMLMKLFSVIFSQVWMSSPTSMIKRAVCRATEVSLGLAVGFALAYIGYHVMNTYSMTDGLFLCYPVFIYILLFWGKIKRMVLVTPDDDNDLRSRNVCSDRGLKLSECSVTPDLIRNDIEILKTDFNCRIKEVLFHSLLITYYMTVIPVLFAQSTLYYDPWWVSQHVVIVWLTCFLFCLSYYLPPCYIDNLHQHAVFLGKWQIVQGRAAHVPYNAWSELQVWPQNSMVKHVRGLFKATGLHNTAEPGNAMHIRFHFLFNNPMRITNWLTMLSWSLVTYQLIVLVQSTEWNHILCISMLLFCNYFLLFRLMRDRFVLTRTYADTRVIKLS